MMQFNSIALEEVIDDEGQASYTHLAAKPSYLALAVPSQALQTEKLRRSWTVISDTLSPAHLRLWDVLPNRTCLYARISLALPCSI